MGERIYVAKFVFYDKDERKLISCKSDPNLKSKRFAPMLNQLFLDFHKAPDRKKSAYGDKNTINKISMINMLGVSVGMLPKMVIRSEGEGFYQASLFIDTENHFENMIKNMGDSGDLAKAIAETYLRITRENQTEDTADGNWFLSETIETKDEKLKDLFFNEVNRHIAVLVSKAQSVLSEYSSSVVIDVSEWPVKPYHVTNTVRLKRVGVGANDFYECFHFRDKLRAESFRYTSIRLVDEEGVEILNLNKLPTYENGIISFQVDGWDAVCCGKEQKIKKQKGSSIELIEIKMRKSAADGGLYKVDLRSWECSGAEYEWECREKNSPKKGKEGEYFSTDVRITTPQDTKIAIELVCTFDAWSIGINTFFTEYVYAPSVRASITGENDEYRFSLRQFSSQSPFWRRNDGKHIVPDLATETLNERCIAWKYTGQWLMVGEGYAIVVEASKA